MLQLKPRNKLTEDEASKLVGTLGVPYLPTLQASEDFEGTETLLRREIKEGWQEPKEEQE